MSTTYMKPADMQFVIEMLEGPSGASPADCERACKLAEDFREQMKINRSRVRTPQRRPYGLYDEDNKAKWFNLEPDWMNLWTAPQAEQQLKDFKFTGPGWYLTKTDSMLVIPDSSRPILQSWAAKRLSGEYFKFLVWNKANPCAAFNNVANAPVRLDIRG